MPSVISAELLASLGLSEKEVQKIVSSLDSNSKTKKLVANLEALLLLLEPHGGLSSLDGPRRKALFQAAQSLGADVLGTNKSLFIKYLLVDGSDSIMATAKMSAAIACVAASGGVELTEPDFREAAGVGVSVSFEDVKTVAITLVEEHRDAIVEAGYTYQAALMKPLRAMPKMIFAEQTAVKGALEECFFAILGERTPENTKKPKGKGKGGNKTKDSKKKAVGTDVASSAADSATSSTQGGGEVLATAATIETSTTTTLRAAERYEAERRELLTKVALEFDLNVDAVLRKFADANSGADGSVDDEQEVNPVTVADKKIDYTRLIDQFGTELLDEQIIARFERLTGKPAHHFLRRGIFFSHRDISQVLDAYERGEPFYLYTGRGPSSDSMHLGHLVPFMFTKYLQDAFGCPLVVQMTDDEKYLWKDLTPEQLEHTLRENVRDIIACGFDREKTFIFSDFRYVGGPFYQNIVLMQKRITANMAMKSLGLSTLDNIGRFAWSAVQAAPSFSSSFPHIFGPQSSHHCLIPCAIDQDVYFRITREVAPRLGYKKPAVIHSIFFPGMGGTGGKMSSSVGQDKTIFMTDTAAMIKDKVTKYAFSGARGTTADDLRELGADLEMDTSYQYLRFFMEDDAKLEDIASKYSKGQTLTGEVKAELISVLQELIINHQSARASISDDEIEYFMSPDAARFGKCRGD